MGQNLPLSPDQLSDEGSPQAEILQGPAGSSSPQLAQKQLVSSPPGAQASSLEDPSSGVISGSANQDCVRFILDNERVDFMGFLKFAAQ